MSRDPILKPIQIGDYVGWLLPHLNLIYRPQSLHPYVYVQNNPVIWIDPYGLGWWSDLIDWFRNVICYIVPSPVPEAVGVCEAAPDILRICVYAHEYNEMGEEIGFGPVYPGAP